MKQLRMSDKCAVCDSQKFAFCQADIFSQLQTGEAAAAHRAIAKVVIFRRDLLEEVRNMLFNLSKPHNADSQYYRDLLAVLKKYLKCALKLLKAKKSFKDKPVNKLVAAMRKDYETAIVNAAFVMESRRWDVLPAMFHALQERAEKDEQFQRLVDILRPAYDEVIEEQRIKMEERLAREEKDRTMSILKRMVLPSGAPFLIGIGEMDDFEIDDDAPIH